MDRLFELSAADAARLIKEKKVSSTELTRACLERIKTREDRIHAWQYVDYEGAMAAAARADNALHRDGALHGIPIGLKDIIDTAHLPTTYGSKAFAGYHPKQHADCVTALQDNGAIIIGKTVTTEFAFFAPGPTVNPHNTAHTPGGSSSGSAAAVADFHVPIALGTQTAGSIIRPASFNGVLGYKPSYNTYSKNGVHPLAPSLDTLGSFTRTVEDFHLLNHVLAMHKPAVEFAPKQPAKVAVVRSPYWDQATEDMRTAFDSYAHALADANIEIVDATDHIDELNADLVLLSECQLLLMAIEAKEVLEPIAAKHGELIRAETMSLIEQGMHPPPGAEKKIEQAKLASKNLMANLHTLADVILTPSALGAAPLGIDATGDPIFNRAWTFAQAPCVNIPITRDEAQLPIGVQLVGTHGGDENLMSYAECLFAHSHYQMSPPA